MKHYSGPVRGPGGVVYSGGLGMRPRNSEPPFTARGAPFRAIVLATYVMGDPDEGTDPSEGASNRVGLSRVEADVVLVRSGTILRAVPVMPDRWGRNDARPWVPRKTTRTLSDNQPLSIESIMSFRGDVSSNGATPLDDVDGDIVLVEFIEEDIHFPFIRNAYPHPRSLRSIIEGTGWSEGGAGSERGVPEDLENYFRFAGVEARINDDGDVLLDTVGATSDKVDEDPNTGAGQVRVRMKASERLTVEMDGTDVLEIWKDGSQVKVDLGEGAAERLVLGDGFLSFINGFLSTEFKLHRHGPGTYTTPSGAVTLQSGPVEVAEIPPVTVPPPNFTGIQMGDDLLSDLSRTKKS